MSLDRLEEALQEMKTAQELDPVSPLTNGALAQMFYCQRNYDQAISFSRRAFEIEPDMFVAHHLLSLAYEQKGMYKEALQAIKEARKFAGNDSDISDTLEALGHVSATIGRKDEARKAIAKLLEIYRAKPESVPPISLALVHDALGERDEALKWVEKQFKDRMGMSVIYRFDPRLNSLKSDPRYEALYCSRESNPVPRP